MYKIRFNLGRGKNYKKWKIVNPDKTIQIIDPRDFNILLMNATLCNNKKSALKIFNGANKSVCAWIEAEEIMIQSSNNKFIEGIDLKEEISYNPRVKPYWQYKGGDCDNKNFESIITKENKVFIV